MGDVGDTASPARFPNHDSIAVSARDDRVAVRRIRQWLWERVQNPGAKAETYSATDLRTLSDEVHQLRLAVEAFVAEWSRTAADAALGSDDRRTGDALAAMASEVVKSEDPPNERPAGGVSVVRQPT